MRIWIPELSSKSGASVYTGRLIKILQELGHEIELTPLAIEHQGFPFFLKFKKPRTKPDVVIADSITGAMFKGVGKSLIIIEHHCIFDPAYAPYRSLAQTSIHELLWRRYEKRSLEAADAIVCVSKYTASSIQKVFGKLPVHVIKNAIDTNYFCPDGNFRKSVATDTDRFRILNVGNLTKRKGVDLLPEIMSKLGSHFELRYTSGLRTKDCLSDIPNTTSLGRLNDSDLLEEYQRADILLFPTRFEGFGYAAAEAMACATPVVASDCSSLPELIDTDINGILCPTDDTGKFVSSIKYLANNPTILNTMGKSARLKAISDFRLDKMTEGYTKLFRGLE